MVNRLNTRRYKIRQSARLKRRAKSLSLYEPIKKEMNIQGEKLDIIQWLASVNDIRIIKQFILLKRSNEDTTFINLTQAEKDAIDEGLQSIKDGRFKSHEEVTEITKKKYPQLFK